jgi:RNA polymerase sigma factor (sigma-70 family)
LAEDGAGIKPIAKDQQFIDDYLAGREEAFQAVEAWVLREIDVRYAGLGSEREDLCQQVHEKLLSSLRAGRFHGESALKTYVVSVVHHTCIDALRRRYLREAGDLPENAPASWGNPYREMEARESRSLLHVVLHRSPELCRRLWRMIFMEKLHYSEIGLRLGIPSGTVKSRVFACRQKALAIYRRLTRPIRA